MTHRRQHFPRLPRLPRLLPARHHRSSLEQPGARSHATQSDQKIRHRSDDRRPLPHHRRPRIAADPLHPTRGRTDSVAQPAQVRLAGPAVAKNQRRTGDHRKPRVVPTGKGWPSTFSAQPHPAPLIGEDRLVVEPKLAIRLPICCTRLTGAATVPMVPCRG
jgi:hypothetical protein